MERKLIKTNNAPQAIGPYSQGVVINNMVYTSGQIPINPQTGDLISDIQAATKQSLENVKAVLEAGGSSLENVIKVSIFLNDMNDFAKVNEVYATYFNENPPARSCVEVARLPKDSVIEIEAIGIVK